MAAGYLDKSNLSCSGIAISAGIRTSACGLGSMPCSGGWRRCQERLRRIVHIHSCRNAMSGAPRWDQRLKRKGPLRALSRHFSMPKPRAGRRPGVVGEPISFLRDADPVRIEFAIHSLFMERPGRSAGRNVLKVTVSLRIRGGTHTQSYGCRWRFARGMLQLDRGAQAAGPPLSRGLQRSCQKAPRIDAGAVRVV